MHRVKRVEREASDPPPATRRGVRAVVPSLVKEGGERARNDEGGKEVETPPPPILLLNHVLGDFYCTDQATWCPSRLTPPSAHSGVLYRTDEHADHKAFRKDLLDAFDPTKEARTKGRERGNARTSDRA
jgi:hypothetical protein